MGESVQPRVNSWLKRIENGTRGPTGTEGREEKREEGKWRKEKQRKEEGGSGNSWIDAVEAERTIRSFLATRGHGNGACRDRGVPRRLRTSSFPLLSPLSPLPSSRLRCPSSSLEGFNVVNSLLIWSLSVALIWSLSVALRVHSRGSTLRTPASSGPSPSPFKFGST